MSTRGIFLLENVRSRQREGDWVSVDNVWVSPSYGVPFAYLSGGRAPGPVYVSVVDKLSFGSDSVARSPSADLDINRWMHNPVSSSTAAYWMTGSTPGPGSSWTNQTSKTTYTTDTTAASPNFPNVGPPYNSLGWESLGSTATETTGYVGGGMPTPMYSRTYLFKLDFSTDGYSQLPQFPQEQGQTGDALGNQTHGYWSGGIQKPSGSPNSYGAYTRVVRYTYSTDTFSNVGTLPGPRKKVSASGNATEGYIYGGIDGHPSGSATWHSTAIKLTYSTDTTSLNPSNLPEYPRIETRGSGNLSNGYVVGAGDPVSNSNIFKFDYSTGTQSTPAGLKRSGNDSYKSAIASARAYGHPGKFPTERWKDGASETMNKGHFSTDTNNGGLYSLEMNTDSAALMPAAANNYVSFQAQGFSNLTNGWWGGGSNPGGTSIDQIVKTPYATDTPNPSVASMVERRRGPMIAGNMTHARIAGGFSHDNPGDRRSNFEKFTYSTESAAMLPSVNLPQKDSKGGGSGNQELGYYTGGEYSYSWYVKVTYSTDTGGQVPSANQSPVNGPSSRSFASTLANFRAGASTDSVQKVPFATDTFSLLPSVSPANLGGNSGGAAANRTHGYYTHANGASWMYKMSFATETADQLTTYPTTNGMGNSLQGQSNGPVTSNPNVETSTPETSAVTTDFGLRLPGGTTIDKLDFTTDTISVGMEMPSDVPETGGHDGDAWYDQNGGRAIFGTGGASGPINQINMGSLTGSRIPSLSPVATVPNTSYGIYKSWNYSATEGWYQGGRSWSPSYPSHNTTASRMTFATDTLSDQSYGRLSVGIERAQGLSNPTHKYSIGGRTSNGSGDDRSYTFKASFTSGDFSQVPSGNLNAKTSDHGGTGNATEGYIAGRYTSPSNGASPESRFQKLTYSNDTMSTLPGSTLGISVPDMGRGLEGTGNQTTGYFGGGDYMGPLNGNNFPVVKLVYATGTPSTIPHWVTDSNTRGAAQQSSGEQNGNGKSPVPNMMK